MQQFSSACAGRNTLCLVVATHKTQPLSKGELNPVYKIVDTLPKRSTYSNFKVIFSPPPSGRIRALPLTTLVLLVCNVKFSMVLQNLWVMCKLYQHTATILYRVMHADISTQFEDYSSFFSVWSTISQHHLRASYRTLSRFIKKSLR